MTSSAVFPNAPPQPGGFMEIGPGDVARRQADVLLVDVREPGEWVGELGHIDGALLMPMSQWPDLASKVDVSRPVVMVCRSGRRSAQAAQVLARLGATEVYNLQGGMIAWNQMGLPVARK